MREALLVAVGGAVGALCRYGVNRALAHYPFPFGTLVVNVVGCFSIGMLAPILGQFTAAPAFRAVLMTGFLGALTTFSAFGYDTMQCYVKDGWPMAATNVLAQVALGLLAVWLGLRTASLWV